MRFPLGQHRTERHRIWQDKGDLSATHNGHTLCPQRAIIVAHVSVRVCG